MNLLFLNIGSFCCLGLYTTHPKLPQLLLLSLSFKPVVLASANTFSRETCSHFLIPVKHVAIPALSLSVFSCGQVG